MSTLILNSDAAPLSYLPLSVIPWEESIKYLVLDKASVIEYHRDWIVRSARWSTSVPAVMILKQYEKRKTTLRFSKNNIFLRDQFTCQYCGIAVNRRTATLDHVKPVSLGGKSTWENCTTSCGRCNSIKGNSESFLPKIKPYKPNYYELVEKRKKMPWDMIHPAWANYILV
jgi:5-methylcytosine-specific restriction endonuclease McrA